MKTRILILATGLLCAFTSNAQRKLSRDKIQITKTKSAKVLGTDERGNVFDNSVMLDTLASKSDLQSFPFWNKDNLSLKFGTSLERNIEILSRRSPGDYIRFNYPRLINNASYNIFKGQLEVLGGVSYKDNNISGTSTIKKHPQTNQSLTFYLPKGSNTKLIDTLAALSDIPLPSDLVKKVVTTDRTYTGYRLTNDVSQNVPYASGSLDFHIVDQNSGKSGNSGANSLFIAVTGKRYAPHFYNETASTNSGDNSIVIGRGVNNKQASAVIVGRSISNNITANASNNLFGSNISNGAAAVNAYGLNLRTGIMNNPWDAPINLFGSSLIGNQANITIIGNKNNPNRTQISGDPDRFVVGIGEGSGTGTDSKKNGLVVTKNGRIIAPELDISEITEAKSVITLEHSLSPKDLFKLNAKPLPTLTATDRAIVLDSADNKLKFWNGTTWNALF